MEEGVGERGGGEGGLTGVLCLKLEAETQLVAACVDILPVEESREGQFDTWGQGERGDIREREGISGRESIRERGGYQRERERERERGGI